MMAQLIDRRQLKAEAKDLLRSAQVNPRAMAALYLALVLVMNLADSLAGGMGSGLAGTFVAVLSLLLNVVLGAGFTLYCMAIRRGERAEFLTLFDGFSFVGKVIGLSLLTALFVFLWSLLFFIPGIIAGYRYRFAMYNLCENPEISILDALDMSKQQTSGYKGQLFMLDLSYLGWGLLASLPGLIQAVYIYSLMLQSIYNNTDPAAPLGTLGASLLVSFACWLWAMLVQVLYLPHYQCVELGYFDIAKQTSGVGDGIRPSQDGWGGGSDGQSGGWNGPDDLGGY